MAERIEQEFVINASKALDEMAKLDKAFASFETRAASLAKTLGTLNGVGGGGLASLKSDARDAATNVRSITDALNATNKAGGSAAVTFATLGRVVQTQLTVAALGAFRGALQDSVGLAGDLQRQFALIGTIATTIDRPAGQPRASVDQSAISRGAREVSDSLNIPQLKVAEGLYQAVSNQVGTFAESLQFSAEVGKLARATNSSLADSVDGVSAVLKSYGLTSASTAEISNTVFNIIDKGRVSADQLGSSLGRILPAAAELGVSFEEVGAALAQISVKGLSTSESITQVRATFSGLLKPSEALKDAYDALGVASGQAGIRQFGLVGLLEQLRNSVGGSGEALAALFPNVRNLGAVLALTGSNLKEFEATFKSFTDGTNNLDSAFNLVRATDIEVISDASNKLQNSLADVATSYVKFFADITRSAGGAGVSQNQFDAIATGAVNTTIQLGVVAAAAGVARLAFIALSFNPFTVLITGAIALGVAIGQTNLQLEELRLDRFEADLKAVGQVKLDGLKGELKVLGMEAKISAQLVKDGLTAISKDSAPAVNAYSQAIASAVASNKLYQDSVKATLDRITSLRAAFASGLRQEAATSRADALNSAQTIVPDLQQELGNRRFSRSLESQGPNQQSESLLRRASQLAAQATTDLLAATRAGDENGIARARALFGAAQGAAGEAESSARTANNAQKINEARTAGDRIIQNQIQSEQTLQGIQLRRAKTLEAEALKQEQIVRQLKVQADIVLSNASNVRNDGSQFSERELARRQDARNAALNEVGKLALNQTDFSVSDLSGLTQLRQQFEGQVSGLKAELDVGIVGGADAILNEVQSAITAYNADPAIAKIRIALEQDITTEDLEPFLKKIEDAADARSKAKISQRVAQVTADAARSTGLTAADSVAAEAARTTSSAAVEGVEKIVLEGTSKLKEILAQDPIKLNLDEARAQLAEVADSVAGFDNKGISPEIAISFGTLSFAVRDYLLQLEASKAAIDAVNQNPIKNEGFIKLNTSVNDVTQSIGGAIRAVDSLGQRAAAAAAQVAQAVASSSAGFANTGRFFFNQGGMARGSDTIPAMLGRGESVVNARSTAKFFGQINAMNAGQIPSARGQSNVTNVGDIHVNMNNASSSAVNAREIANDIRRELRRGTSRL